MIRDLESERPATFATADVCVVGAGAAGVALALELAGRGKSVLLLDGDGAETEECEDGEVQRLEAENFTGREWVPGGRWPFAEEELRRHEARALELEGLGNALREDSDVWQSLGMGEPAFADMEMRFSRRGQEAELARLHRSRLTAAEGLVMWLHANAVELLMRDGRATGVRCRTRGGVEAVFEATEYCFCLETVEAIRFFLQPREGGLPWNESGGLGCDMHGYVDVNGAWALPHSARRFHAVFDDVLLGGLKYMPGLRLDGEVQRRLRTLDAAGWMSFLGDGDPTGALTSLPLLARRSWRSAVQHRGYAPANAAIRLRVRCEQEPQSQNRVSLKESRDAMGMMEAQRDWRVTPMATETMRTFLEAVRLSLSGLAQVLPEEKLWTGGGGVQAEGNLRSMGGMAMGESARSGVVDAELRLHGTKNVSVCSAAVFPPAGVSNPRHTLVALAVRLAERLG